jgi:hypothetical protein
MCLDLCVKHCTAACSSYPAPAPVPPLPVTPVSAQVLLGGQGWVRHQEGECQPGLGVPGGEQVAIRGGHHPPGAVQPLTHLWGWAGCKIGPEGSDRRNTSHWQRQMMPAPCPDSTQQLVCSADKDTACRWVVFVQSRPA